MTFASLGLVLTTALPGQAILDHACCRMGDDVALVSLSDTGTADLFAAPANSPRPGSD
jgi:hypothetical protein